MNNAQFLLTLIPNELVDLLGLKQRRVHWGQWVGWEPVGPVCGFENEVPSIVPATGWRMFGGQKAACRERKRTSERGLTHGTQVLLYRDRAAIVPTVALEDETLTLADETGGGEQK